MKYICIAQLLGAQLHYIILHITLNIIYDYNINI